ncbi:MAG: NYN domain-containing protein, partial [Anaerotignum sp.]|nr:NYN domain-containing protein [Anaerotignum sp.]
GDGLEQLIISGQGAIRMTARELWNEVQAVETELRERFIENRPPKNNILADHLDEESLAWFEALRRQK